MVNHFWFFDQVFYATYADIGSLKSLQTLFDKYLDHMLMKFEHYRIYGLNYTKMVNHFCQKSQSFV